MGMTRNWQGELAKKRIRGTYAWPGCDHVAGELRLRGARTQLKVHSEKFLARIENADCIHGVAHTGEILTLVGCQSSGTATTSVKDGPPIYHAEVFPHFVVIGRQKFSPAQPSIHSIRFSSIDLTTLFYDFDAFGFVVNASSVIDTVLRERREMRAVETGASPLVCYYTGRERIVEVKSEIGTISVYHSPAYNFGGPDGLNIRNRMTIAIELANPIALEEAIYRIDSVTCFLSMAAGRAQGVQGIQVLTSASNDDDAAFLSVHASFPPSMGPKVDAHKPHPADVPFDPIHRRSEFEAALANWIQRHEGWRFARSRYVDCIRNGNQYGTDRLVAAANMFDVLPNEAVPLGAEVGSDLASARDVSVAAFRKLPASSARDSALSALGRIGKPSLPNKVAHRIGVVLPLLGERFQDLQLVASTAVKCRNFLVHGNSADINYAKIERFVPFLTDALEFIFAASDFIDAGWDARIWISRAGGWGHSFSRFRSNYDETLALLRIAMAA